MAEPSQILTAEELEAMSAAERAAAIDEQLVTDVDSIDDRTAQVVARGSAKIRTRLQRQD